MKKNVVLYKGTHSYVFKGAFRQNVSLIRTMYFSNNNECKNNVYREENTGSIVFNYPGRDRLPSRYTSVSHKLTIVLKSGYYSHLIQIMYSHQKVTKIILYKSRLLLSNQEALCRDCHHSFPKFSMIHYFYSLGCLNSAETAAFETRMASQERKLLLVENCRKSRLSGIKNLVL